MGIQQRTGDRIENCPLKTASQLLFLLRPRKVKSVSALSGCFKQAPEICFSNPPTFRRLWGESVFSHLQGCASGVGRCQRDLVT